MFLFQVTFFTTILLLLVAALAAPTEVADAKEDLAAAEKDDLKTEASHWGGGNYGGYGGKLLGKLLLLLGKLLLQATG